MLNKIFHYEDVTQSLLVALIMAFIGGYLDIYTYMARGKVFANTQTGNLVLLGHNIANSNYEKILYYILPILFFMLGVSIGEWLEHKWEGKKRILWHQISIIIECTILLFVMWIPTGATNIIANILISFACGLQVQTFRKANQISYSSTMFTGNVKNAAERLSNFMITKNKAALETGVVYISMIVSFIVGAGVGTYFTEDYGKHSVGFASMVLLVLFFVVGFGQRTKEKY